MDEKEYKKRRENLIHSLRLEREKSKEAYGIHALGEEMHWKYMGFTKQEAASRCWKAYEDYLRAEHKIGHYSEALKKLERQYKCQM